MPAHAGRSMPVNAGRGLNPRPERSTPARAEEQSPETKINPLPLLVLPLRALCRSGVEPPTGTIHPRRGRGTESRKQKSIPCLCSCCRSASSMCPFPICRRIAMGRFQTPERRRWQVAVFRTLFLCFRVGGSFRSGVEPPTGTRTTDIFFPPRFCGIIRG